jgi:hypothetical protein
MPARVNRLITVGELALVSTRMKTVFGFSWISVSNSPEKFEVGNLGVC